MLAFEVGNDIGVWGIGFPVWSLASQKALVLWITWANVGV